MKVFYVFGHDTKGQRVDLAKFFSRDDAEAHRTAKYPRVTSYQPWRDVNIEEREESLEDQHVAHGGKVGAS